MNILTEHQSAALDFSHHVSLTSNAGSGKTFVLAKRFIEIALHENIDLGNIAAITFTDKAAGELYNKISEEIENHIRITSDQVKINRLGEIRRQLLSANISTIHSFCIDILREYPVEAQLDANFIPIDQRRADELIELSVEELIENSFRNPVEAEKLKYLIRILGSKINFTRELSHLIRDRKNVIYITEKIYGLSKDENEIAEFFYSQYKNWVGNIFFRELDKLFTAITQINNYVLSKKPGNEIALNVESLINNFFNQTDFETKIASLKLLRDTICTKNAAIKIRGYLPNSDHVFIEEVNFVENYFSDFDRLEEPGEHKIVELELAKFGKTIIGFFNDALDIFYRKKNRNGFLDYEDILLYTMKVLSFDHVQKSLSAKFKYMMIDEYQDTNEIQYRIFLPILDNLKKGKLFIVGDEKQSIYMFRDAELEVFYRTKKDIAAIETQKYLLSLPDSFRMAPPICLFANKLFGNLFKNPNDLFNEVEQSEIVCAKQDQLFGSVEIILKVENKTAEAEPDEAELVSRRILKLFEDQEPPSNFNWGSIAVLVRKRKSFDELERAFLKYNIPYVIVGGRGFYQKQTVYDIYNYFSFLMDQMNDAALAGILRSPFFMLSDREIFEISLENSGSFWEKLTLYSTSKNKLTQIHSQLKQNISLANNVDSVFLLRKILNETNYLAVAASKPDGMQEIANIEKLIKLTIDFFSEGFKTLYDYVDFLKTSIEYSDDESQASISEESNAVKIMTLHQAKGLEFPAVFLFKCNDKTERDTVAAQRITVNKSFGLLTKVYVLDDYISEPKQAPVAGINDLITYKKNLAELKRLLYVGVTRAKNFLFVSASTGENMNVSKESFLGLLIEGLNIDLTSDSITIDSDLKYLRLGSGKYIPETKKETLIIPLIKNIDERKNLQKGEKQEFNLIVNEKTVNISELKTESSGEIISATKVSVFSQCPVKYQLIYEFGFSAIYEKYKSWIFKSHSGFTGYEFNPLEDQHLDVKENGNRKGSFGQPTLKGRIVHKVLQKMIPANLIGKFVSDELKKNKDILEFEDKQEEKLLHEIIKDLDNFYNSGIFSEINSFMNFKNEFELYIRGNDYYLFGIIDRIIFDDNRIIIVDYKSDSISENEIEARSAAYLNQLKFYAYLISKYYQNIRMIELRLIYLSFPDKPIIHLVTENDLTGVKEIIMKMIDAVRKNEYRKNLSHCSACRFSDNRGKCIKN